MGRWSTRGSLSEEVGHSVKKFENYCVTKKTKILSHLDTPFSLYYNFSLVQEHLQDFIFTQRMQNIHQTSKEKQLQGHKNGTLKMFVKSAKNLLLVIMQSNHWVRKCVSYQPLLLN